MRIPPRLSFCIPAHATGADLLARSLASLRAQTVPPQVFEVVVGMDGGDPDHVLERTIQPQSLPFRVRLISSYRGGDWPHRNHARNAALAHASGDLVWIVDSDFIWPPHAVAHAIQAMDSSLGRKRAVALTPVLVNIDLSPKEWLSKDIALLTRPTTLMKLLSELPHSNEYSGFADRVAADSAARIVDVGSIAEGFPLVHRAVLEALEGFDESFTGWGGNKEELCRRLGTLNCISYRLLASVMALHQPHLKDGGRSDLHPLTIQNREIFQQKMRELAGGAAWWQRQSRNAELAVSRLIAYSRPRPTRHVGILTVSDSTKGLWRDASILQWVLRAGPVRNVGHEAFVSIFCASDINSAAHGMPDLISQPPPEPTPDAVVGMRLDEWLYGLDVVVVVEVLPQGLAHRLLRGSQSGSGRRLIYVVNLDWAAVDDHPERWVGEVRKLKAEFGDSFILWAKTRESRQTLADYGIEALYIPWTISDEVIRSRRAIPARSTAACTFLANLGMGGWRGRRCADVLLKAWDLASQQTQDIHLIIKTIRPLSEQVAPTLLEHQSNLTIVEGHLSRSRLTQLVDQADVYVHASRWEGFGLPLAEALHAGLPCITVDASPMNELVRDYRSVREESPDSGTPPEKGGTSIFGAADGWPAYPDYRIDGILISGVERGLVRLAPHVEPDPEELAAAIVHLANDPSLVRRLSAPEPGVLKAKQSAFLLLARASILGEAPPRIAVVAPDIRRLPGGERRSEEFWCEGLRLHGYDVRYLDTRPHLLESQLRSQSLDAVWVSKIDIAALERIRAATRAPVLLWHHDLVNYSQQRAAWWERIANRVDAAALPEGNLGRYSGIHTPLRTVLPGAQNESEHRYPGRRPASDHAITEDEAFRGVVFLGGCDGASDPRRAVIEAMKRSGIPFRIYGKREEWSAHRLEADAPVFGSEAHQVYRNSAVALCISRGNPTLYYTSNRLFNAAASGAVLLTHRFEGLDWLMPCAVQFNTPEEAVAQVRRLLKDPAQRSRLRIDAEDQAFRRHTFWDRVSELLRWSNFVFPFREYDGGLATSAKKESRRVGVNTARELAGWWENRATLQGARGAGHVFWNDARHIVENTKLWSRLKPLLAQNLRERDNRILDFGCGPGTFSLRLAKEFGCQVVGVEVSPTFARIARSACQGVEFEAQLIDPANPQIRLDSDSVDVLLSIMTLQCVPDELFSDTVLELRRVLKPGATLLLVENTHQAQSRTSQYNHVVFRARAEYKAAFPGLAIIETFQIEGEEHTVFYGRLLQ